MRGAAKRRDAPSAPPPSVESKPEAAEAAEPKAEAEEPKPQPEATPQPETPPKDEPGVYRVAPGRALTGGPRGMLEAGAKVTAADCGGDSKRLRKLCEEGYLKPPGGPA